MRTFLAPFVVIFSAFAVFFACRGIAYADACYGNLVACSAWGPLNGGQDPGPYPGYCCQTQVAGITACNPPGNATDSLNTQASNCGRLRQEYWDPLQLKYVCGNVISNYSCGGNAGVNGGCQQVPCGA